MKPDNVIKNPSPTFSKILQSSNHIKKRYCPLCSKAGIESLVNDEDVCQYCGDVGITHGVSKDDELFVVNSVGGSDPSEGGGSSLAFGTFGGFTSLDEKRPQPTQKSLQDALKETEI